MANKSVTIPPLQQLVDKSKELIGAGLFARALEHLEAAERSFQSALGLYQQLEIRAGIARSLRDLGGTHLEQGHWEQARGAFEKARDLFSQESDGEGVLVCVVSQAMVCLNSQGRSAAIDYYQSQLGQGDLCRQDLVYNNLAFLCLLEEQFAQARSYASLGLEHCCQHSVRDDTPGLLHLNLGILNALDAKPSEADEHLRQAANVLVEFRGARTTELVVLPETASRDHGLSRLFLIEDGDQLAMTFLNTAVVAQMRGDLELALDLARKAVDFDGDQGYPYAVLGWLQLACGMPVEALASLTTACQKDPRHEFMARSRECAEISSWRHAKVGRNDPCPCGSGKKFKKCHGAGGGSAH